MTKPLSVAEAAVAYETGVADLQQPLILQQEGQPLAVIVSFAEYQRYRALAADEVQRRQVGWQALETLLADVHQRPTDYTPEQIEAEIGAARAEVKQARVVLETASTRGLKCTSYSVMLSAAKHLVG